jgi:hypothetical protein
MVELTGFVFHFCVDNCSWPGLFSVLYIGLCRVGLSGSLYVWFDSASFVCEYVARIAVILVKTARLIESPRPVHAFFLGGGGGRLA